MLKLTKDDIIITILSIFLAIAVSVPIIFVMDMNQDSKEKLKARNEQLEREITISSKNDKVVEITDKETETLEVTIPKEEKKQENIEPSKPKTTGTGKAFYKNSLTSSERVIYDLICTNVEAFNEEAFSIPPINSDSLVKIYRYVTFDHEEYFYFENISYTSNSSKNATSVRINFNCTKDIKKQRKQQIDSIVDELLAKMSDMSEYDKVKFAHDYIVSSTDYVLGSTDNQNICSVFLGKQSVCAGYSRALQYILRKANVYCIYLTGQAKDSPANVPVGHAWNLVRIDGNYYYIDSTFDDPTHASAQLNINYLGYEYFNMTTDELLINHTIDSDIPPLPIANSIEANYYVKEGLYYNKFDSSTIQSLINKIAENTSGKQRLFSFKFSDSTSYSRAVSELLTNGKQINDVLEKVNNKNDVTNKVVSNSLSYLLNDSKYIISIILSYK